MNPCRVLACPTQMQRLTAQAKLFQALADPTRLVVLRALMNRPLRVVDLCTLTGKAQPNVSAHLACLRQCGLVVGTSRGRETYYSVVEEHLTVMLVASDKVASKLGAQICECPLMPTLG